MNELKVYTQPLKQMSYKLKGEDKNAIELAIVFMKQQDARIKALEKIIQQRGQCCGGNCSNLS